MRKSVIVGGSVGIVVLLVLTMMSTIVCAQAVRTSIKDMISETLTKKSNNERMQTLQEIKKLITTEGWYPGWFLSKLGGLIFEIIIYLIGLWFLLP